MVAFVDKDTKNAVENCQFLPEDLRDATLFKNAVGLKSHLKTAYGSNNQLDVAMKAAEAGYKCAAGAITETERDKYLGALAKQYSYSLVGQNEITQGAGKIFAWTLPLAGKLTVGGAAGLLGGFGFGFAKATKFFTSNPNAGLGEKVLGALIAVPFGVAAGAVTGVVGMFTGSFIGTAGTNLLGKLTKKAGEMTGLDKQGKALKMLKEAANLGAIQGQKDIQSGKIQVVGDTEPVQNVDQQPSQAQADPTLHAPAEKIETAPTVDAETTTQKFNQVEDKTTSTVKSQVAGKDSLETAGFEYSAMLQYANQVAVQNNSEAKAIAEAALEMAKKKYTELGGKADSILPMSKEQFTTLNAADLHHLSSAFGGLEVDKVLNQTLTDLGKDQLVEYRKTLPAEKKVTQGFDVEIPDAAKNLITSDASSLFDSNEAGAITAELKKKFPDFEMFPDTLQNQLMQGQKLIHEKSDVAEFMNEGMKREVEQYKANISGGQNASQIGSAPTTSFKQEERFVELFS